MDRLKMQSVDGVQKNIEQIGQIFPDAVTEVIRDGKVEKAIDFDVLKQELSNSIVEGREERYQFTWPDKKKSILAANAPINATLRPCVEESVGRDGTPGGFDSENLYIEGDNFEVLKLLQETYLGKIKMIYIDPPYNTGNDFVYDDDFAENAGDYAKHSGQYDEMGNRLVVNTENNGRFHTDWLNMIYPRLKLAKSLMRDDGVIFISIDDNEVANLRKVCDEIFGSSQFIAQITLLCNPKGRSQDKYVATCHEYLLIYSKKTLPTGSLSIPKTELEVKDDYPLQDKNGSYRELELRNTHREFGKYNRKNLWYPIYVDRNNNVSLDPSPNSEEVYPIWEDGFEGCWTWGKDKATENLNLLTARKVNGNTKIYRKAYALENGNMPLKQVKSIWNDKRFFTEKGQKTINDLFESKEKLFQSPKSVEMIKQCIQMSQDKDEIVLDFFSGSCSSAQAVMQLNFEDGGSRKFIMIQIQENCTKESDAYKAGYNNICDIGKQRIQLAGKKILKEFQEKEPNMLVNNIDVGFRVLKLDESNMKNVYYNPGDVTQTVMDEYIDNIKPDRSPEDLLFQVMLDLAIPLSSKIRKTEIEGKAVYDVEEGYLIACFDNNVTDETVISIAKEKPQFAVFRDSSMADDSVATNFDQIFETYSPDTVRKVL